MRVQHAIRHRQAYGAGNVGKMPNSSKQEFLKKGVDRFSKKLRYWNQRDVSFRVAKLTSYGPSDPFKRTVQTGSKLIPEAVASNRAMTNGK